jgi:hypothetical protein
MNGVSSLNGKHLKLYLLIPPLIIVGAAALYSLNASRMVFTDPDEARYVTIARNMLDMWGELYLVKVTPRAPEEAAMLRSQANTICTGRTPFLCLEPSFGLERPIHE